MSLLLSADMPKNSWMNASVVPDQTLLGVIIFRLTNALTVNCACVVIRLEMLIEYGNLNQT